MTYFHDLSVYSYTTGRHLAGVYNVGWLDAEHEFPRGRPADSVALAELVKESLPYSRVAQMRGFHVCELCSDQDWNQPVTVGGLQYVLGSAECWFPGPEGIIYALPTLVVHYVREHHYRPPVACIDAVRAFAEAPIQMETEYTRRLRKP